MIGVVVHAWDEGEPIWVGLYKPEWILEEGNQIPIRIHIESQKDKLNDAINVEIHYETNPYEERIKIKGKYSNSQYECFLQKQMQFLNHVWQYKCENLQLESGWRKICSKKILIDTNMKVSDLQLILMKQIQFFADIIDNYLQKK